MYLLRYMYALSYLNQNSRTNSNQFLNNKNFIICSKRYTNQGWNMIWWKSQLEDEQMVELKAYYSKVIIKQYLRSQKN